MFRMLGRHLKDQPGRCIKTLFISFLLSLVGFVLLYFQLAFINPILMWLAIGFFVIGFQLSVIAYFYFWRWRVDYIVARNTYNQQRFKNYKP